MDNRASIATLLAEIDEMTPGGFAIGLHISFGGPELLFQTFPIDWMDYYIKNSLHLVDPAVKWSFEETGFRRWRDLARDDPSGVIRKAATFGMKYGATMAVEAGPTRSVLGCARNDRDYLDYELQAIMEKLLKLHKTTQGLKKMPQRDIEALQKMSIRLSHS